jgi:hypothetical protein
MIGEEALNVLVAGPLPGLNVALADAMPVLDSRDQNQNIRKPPFQQSAVKRGLTRLVFHCSFQRLCG